MSDAVNVPGHSVLQFPVAELEPVVRARHEHYDADYVSADPAFTHAHITALGPFLTPDEMTRHNLDLVASVVALTTPFAFTLERVGVFPNGIVHLLPEPAAPFRRVTDQLCAAFPDKPPYAAQFPAVTAHLTLDAVSATVSLVSTRRLLGGLVPARCRADRLDLAWYEPGNCHLVTSWRLGAPG